MSNKNKIKSKLELANDANAIRLKNQFRQKRFKKLIDIHGIANVALAAGLKESSLQQYIRVSNPINIREDSVKQAEDILRDIDPE